MNERTFNPQRAHKLEDPDRKNWLPTDEVVSSLSLRPGMVVADVGAGTGYFAFPIARATAPGLVYAVDAQEEMLALIRQKLAADPVPNLIPVSGDAGQTGLPPDACHRVLLANVWHELDHRESVLDEQRRILRGGGLLAILDWREDVHRPPGPPIPHRVSLSNVVGFLGSHHWRIESGGQLGLYSYLVTARPE